MSDVLIKNIEMPKETQCCYTIFPNGKVIVHWDGKVLGEAKAIELPPHGRLIDADRLPVSTLIHDQANGLEIETLELKLVYLKNLQNAPTILEAST